MEISLGFTDPGLSTSFTVLTQIVNHAASGGMAAAKCGSRALFFPRRRLSQWFGVEADASFGAALPKK
jgi:hypothetical protein